MSFISDKKLFYVGKDRKQNRLVVVSEEEKKKVLRECHENGAGVHHGISRTLTLVESSYYWTSVTNDVKQWVWLVSLETFYCLSNKYNFHYCLKYNVHITYGISTLYVIFELRKHLNQR